MDHKKGNTRQFAAFPGRVIPAQHSEQDGIPRLRSQIIHNCREQNVQTETYSSSEKSVAKCKSNLTQTSVRTCQMAQRHNVEFPPDSKSQLIASENQPDRVPQANHASTGVMHNVKQKLSGNMGNYSNIFQGMSYLFRLSSKEKKSNRSRSGSRSRKTNRIDSNSNAVVINERKAIVDNFMNLEDIELHHMDGFVFSSEKEKGKGHNFVLVQLKAPTWCDKCGDFIWGVYKQCLQCASDQNKCFVPSKELRPQSFLHDEVDEFDRVFSELFFSRHKRMSQITADLVRDDKTPMLSNSPLNIISEREDSEDQAEGCLNNAETPNSTRCPDSPVDKTHRTSDNKVHPDSLVSKGQRTGEVNPSAAQTLSHQAADTPLRKREIITPVNSAKRSSLHEDMLYSYETNSESVQEARSDLHKFSLRKLKSSTWDKNDKLFADLLDDLDSISKLDTESARKRKKARDLFSDWLFSHDVSTSDKRVSQTPPSEGEYLQRTLSGSRLRGHMSQPGIKANRCSADLSNLSPAWGDMMDKQGTDHTEDDADSGYHTGEYSLEKQGHMLSGPLSRPRGEFTLTREDLRKSIEAFNSNIYGLIISLQQDSLTFQGFIRVHMNLIRPISMSLSVRPPSIYDVLSHEEPEEQCNRSSQDTEIASFYLPKDTTKVIHIASDTTTQEVIRTLLSKFKITDNPRKFALYEKLEEKKKVLMRRMADDEQPLPLCLSWGAEGLHKNRFVLQENDPGEIIWDAFSVPELDNFLKILNKEEDEYVEQIKAKYKLMEIHINKKLEEMDTVRQLQGAKACLDSAIHSHMSKSSQRDTGAKTPPHLLKMSKQFGTPSDSGGQARYTKELSPPADQINNDEREPVFV